MEANEEIEMIFRPFEIIKMGALPKRLLERFPLPENEIQKGKEKLKKNPQSELPLFYTDPIFKASKYDLL